LKNKGNKLIINVKNNTTLRVLLELLTMKPGHPFVSTGYTIFYLLKQKSL